MPPLASLSRGFAVRRPPHPVHDHHGPPPSWKPVPWSWVSWPPPSPCMPFCSCSNTPACSVPRVPPSPDACAMRPTVRVCRPDSVRVSTLCSVATRAATRRVPGTTSTPTTCVWAEASAIPLWPDRPRRRVSRPPLPPPTGSNCVHPPPGGRRLRAVPASTWRPSTPPKYRGVNATLRTLDPTVRWSGVPPTRPTRFVAATETRSSISLPTIP